MKVFQIVTVCALVALVGCSTATPASRATTASYEINVKVCMDEGVKSATVNVPFTFVKGAIDVVVTMLIYKPLSKMFTRMNNSFAKRKK